MLSIVLSVVSMIGMGVGFLGVEKSKYVTVTAAAFALSFARW
ncbi:hypothetical protein [Rhizobium sp. YTU87027]